MASGSSTLFKQGPSLYMLSDIGLYERNEPNRKDDNYEGNDDHHWSYEKIYKRTRH